MGIITRLIKNTGYLTVGNQTGNLLQFLFFLYFARQFGDKIVGQYAFAFSFTYMFFVLADLGLSVFLMREVSRDRSASRQIFARCLIVRVIALILFTLMAVAVVLFVFNSFPKETVQIIILLGLYHIFFSLADVFLAEFKGHDRMGLMALLSIFVRFVVSGAGILLILLHFDFLTVLTCFPIGSFLYLLLCVYLSFYYYKKITLPFGSLGLKNLFITILPFTFTIIFVEILYHLDVLMLRFFQDDQAVGIFSAANKIIIAVIGVNIFVHTALLPTFSRLFVDSQSDLIVVSKQSLRLLVVTTLPISVGLFAIADRLIVFLFSETFVYSGDVLKILSWTIALSFAASTYSVLLTAINRQTQKVILLGLCLGFNFLLNLILIPRLSYNGAATAKLITEALILVLMIFLVSKYLTSISIERIFLKPTLGSLLMYVFIRLFSQWNLAFIILTSVAVYFISLGVLRFYTEEELAFVKRLPQKIFSRTFSKAHNSKKDDSSWKG